ncbi:MFS transporter [Chelativorans sp. SCAU2101]|jgi:Arabinose efflux permease|uniref:MFS transporter n=1 Tax=Chelativorans petroleitrophicus TaxID=2975484 RepID=A0A9X2X5T5_9HYPH|nr:MFS transporter [Chelativorans petroleitrophicus]MCT8989727.1 MFS transporter [Chelativorans petroleitrophicus]
MTLGIARRLAKAINEEGSPLQPLATPTFRNLWLWITVSNLGTIVQAVGAGWLMTTLSGQASMVALVQTATTLPIMLFSLAAGALADNFDRRTVMLIAQIFMFTVSAILAVLSFAGGLTPWLLLLFTFLIGSGTALNNPAWQSSLGDLLPRKHLPAAVSLNSIAFNLMRSIGPGIGGLIVAVAGAAAAFAFNAATYVGLIIQLFRLKPAKVNATLPPEHLGAAMSAGLRYVFLSPNIEAILLRSLALGLSMSSIQALLPLVARDLIGGGPLHYGVLLGAFGLGAILAGLFGHRLRERFSSEAYMRLNHLAAAFSAAALPFAGNILAALPIMLVGGAAWLLSFAFCNMSIQLSAPRWVVGRALATYQTAAFGGMALGSWLWGEVAADWGVAAGLQISAGTALVTMLIGVWLPMPELGRLKLDPIQPPPVPELAIDLEARSGPVVVMVEYVIREEDLPEFLAAMRERRRIRRRNGASSWTLMRDVTDPQKWIESYHVPNWIEYLRHHQRTTEADAEVIRRLRALHSLPEPPRVSRLVVRPVSARGGLLAR